MLVVERDAAADGGTQPGLDAHQAVGVLPVLGPPVPGQRVPHAAHRAEMLRPRRDVHGAAPVVAAGQAGRLLDARRERRPAGGGPPQHGVERLLAVVLVLRPGAEHAGRHVRRGRAAVVDERHAGAVGGQQPRGRETPDARADHGDVGGGGEKVISHELPTLVRTRSGSAIAGRVPASQPPVVGLPRSWRIVLPSFKLRDGRRLDRRQREAVDRRGAARGADERRPAPTGTIRPQLHASVA